MRRTSSLVQDLSSGYHVYFLRRYTTSTSTKENQQTLYDKMKIRENQSRSYTNILLIWPSMYPTSHNMEHKHSMCEMLVQIELE